jgi:KDO2-lipid IV(A) lauroyltransferase
MRRPTAAHRVEYAGFRLLAFLLTVFPEALALSVGGLLGLFSGTALRIRRRQVEENLTRAFPHKTRRWRQRIARDCYRHLGREAVSTLRLSRATREAILARTDAAGMEGVRAAVESGRGAILVTGHLGNWEVGGAAIAARGVPLDVVAQGQANPLFDRYLTQTRQRMGLRLFKRSRAARPLLRALREGRAVAFLADQNVRKGGVFVDFFGIPASTARGPAVLSLRTGAPIFVVSVLVRDADGRRYTLSFEEAAIERSENLEDDVRRLTAVHTRILQRWIESAPEQYFWFHKRWRTRPHHGEG